MVLDFETADRSSPLYIGTTVAFFQSRGRLALFNYISSSLAISHPSLSAASRRLYCCDTWGTQKHDGKWQKMFVKLKNDPLSAVSVDLYCSESKNSRGVSMHGMEAYGRNDVWRTNSYTWHEMQMSDQLRAPSSLSPGKGPSLPTGQESIDIVEGVLTFYPHVSDWSNFGVGWGWDLNCYEDLTSPCLLHTQPKQFFI